MFFPSPVLPMLMPHSPSCKAILLLFLFMILKPFFVERLSVTCCILNSCSLRHAWLASDWWAAKNLADNPPIVWASISTMTTIPWPNNPIVVTSNLHQQQMLSKGAMAFICSQPSVFRRRNNQQIAVWYRDINSWFLCREGVRQSLIQFQSDTVFEFAWNRMLVVYSSIIVWWIESGKKKSFSKYKQWQSR